VLEALRGKDTRFDTVGKEEKAVRGKLGKELNLENTR